MENKKISVGKALAERKKLKQQFYLNKIDEETYNGLVEPYEKIIKENGFVDVDSIIVKVKNDCDDDNI